MRRSERYLMRFLFVVVIAMTAYQISEFVRG